MCISRLAEMLNRQMYNNLGVHDINMMLSEEQFSRLDVCMNTPFLGSWAFQRDNNGWNEA